jgi:hypothetical protein
MKEIMLRHYYNSHFSPLLSITRLSEKDAFAFAKQFDNIDETAIGRFNDFINYYPRRIQTEEWLYKEFIKIGGMPQVKNPLYFVLGESEYLNKWFGGKNMIEIALNKIDTEDISFTFGDSCAKMNKPERRNPFMKKELFEYIEKNDGNVLKFLETIKGTYNYIEAQLWNDRYVEKYRREYENRFK